MMLRNPEKPSRTAQRITDAGTAATAQLRSVVALHGAQIVTALYVVAAILAGVFAVLLFRPGVAA
jgi:hypothetical protein